MNAKALSDIYHDYFKVNNPMRRHVVKLALICLAVSKAMNKLRLAAFIMGFKQPFVDMIKDDYKRLDLVKAIERLVLLLISLTQLDDVGKEEFHTYLMEQKESLSPGGQSLEMFMFKTLHLETLDQAKRIDWMIQDDLSELALDPIVLQSMFFGISNPEEFSIIAPEKISTRTIHSLVHEYLEKNGYEIVDREEDTIIGTKGREVSLKVSFSNWSGSMLGVVFSVEEMV